MASKSIEFKLGQLTVCLDRSEAVTYNGVSGAMYDVCVCTPTETWQRGCMFIPSRESDSTLMESKKMEILTDNLRGEFSELAY